VVLRRTARSAGNAQVNRKAGHGGGPLIGRTGAGFRKPGTRKTKVCIPFWLAEGPGEGKPRPYGLLCAAYWPSGAVARGVGRSESEVVGVGADAEVGVQAVHEGHVGLG
jgi:hypothetical protein